MSNNKHIPKHIMHNAVIKHHLFKHGYYDVPSSLENNWYFDINKRVIVREES